jgi:CRAL/TRIO domain
MEPVISFNESTGQCCNDSVTSSKVETILNELSEVEIEAAACSSYRYQQLQNFDATIRRSYAYEMVERYVSSKSDPEIALLKIRSTLKFRSEMGLDNINQLSEDSSIELTKYISDGKAIVQGYDKDGHSTLLFIPRLSTDHSELKRTVLGKVWTIEKAIACSQSKDRKINVVIDLSGFSLFSHTPPIKVGNEVLTILRNHYVGQIHKIFIVNIPSTFSILWNIFSSFIGSQTKGKIVFAESHYVPKGCDTIKENSLYFYYSDIAEIPWMKKDERQCFKLNVDKYLNSMSFDESIPC